MEQLLKQYFWVIQVAGVGAIAILAALAFSNVGSALLAPLTVTAPPAPSVGDDKANKGAGKGRLTNLDNARFAPKPKADEAPPENPDGEVEPPPVLDSDDYPVSDLKVQLTGTMVSDDDRWSMALLYDQASRASFRAKVGESFLDTVKVVKIERDRIIVDREGKLEQIELGGEPGKGGPPGARPSLASKPLTTSLSKPAWSPSGAAKKAVAAPAAKNDKFAELRKGITKNSETNYEVSRATLNKALKNPGKFKDGTRPIPKYEKGKLTGFELTRMSGGSIFSELGMRNGDVITSINGKKIRGPNDALGMYKKLNTAKEIQIGYKRGGVERENSYKIR
jgi:general secretion pathway protein C